MSSTNQVILNEDASSSSGDDNDDYKEANVSANYSSMKGWKSVDLRKQKLWEIAETQNVCARAVIDIAFSNEYRFEGDDFSKKYITQITPCLAEIYQKCLAPIKAKVYESLKDDMKKKLDLVESEFKIYSKGPKQMDGNGKEWVEQNCSNLQKFLQTYMNGYQLGTIVYSKGEHKLEVLALFDMLLDIFAYIYATDADKAKANGFIQIQIGRCNRPLLEQLGESVSKIIAKNFNNVGKNEVQYEYKIIDAVVANKDRITSFLGFCPKSTKVILSNPVSGNIEPFLVPSPRKVEKYTLRKGKAHKRVIGPHCRAAFSYNDLSLPKHKEWSGKNEMKLQHLPKYWDVEQALQPMSLHKSVKTNHYDYDLTDVTALKELNEKKKRNMANNNSNNNSSTGNGKNDVGGGEGNSIIGDTGQLTYRHLEEGLLSMKIGEVAILKVKDPNVENGQEKYFHVQNEGFVEEECGNDCLGCEEGLLLVSDGGAGNSYKFRGIGEYQACKLCYTGCTCESCKSLIKCLLSCSACFAGCGVVVSDALN